MKNIYIIIFILSTITCFSQTQIIDSIPAGGILLNKGWKFKTGDNPDYAKPDLDDSGWRSINPPLDIHDSLPQITRSGICWFRLHLSFDSRLLKSQLALVIQQSGASEIYLNGHLIHRYGIINDDPKKNKNL